MFLISSPRDCHMFQNVTQRGGQQMSHAKKSLGDTIPPFPAPQIQPQILCQAGRQWVPLFKVFGLTGIEPTTFQLTASSYCNNVLASKLTVWICNHYTCNPVTVTKVTELWGKKSSKRFFNNSSIKLAIQACHSS